MKHLACIMSGNRRWASQQGIDISSAHRKGVETIERAISFCIKKSISYLSLYTFSLENFRRPKEQRQFIFSLLVEKAREQVPQLKKEGIRLRFIGDRTRFPKNVIESCNYAEQETASGDRLQVNLLFCYGGRQEIAQSVKKIVAEVQSGNLSIDDITQDTISSYLWTEGIPDPDLLFRPDGDRRTSNFLVYQSVYAELYFTDCLWPEVDEEQLQKAYDYFYACQRNFGT